jgi:NADH-quinone oxidoreductase subunit E
LPTEAECPAIDLSKTEEIIERHAGESRYEVMLPILQEIQEEYGYVPEAAADLVAERLRMNVAKLYALMTFYSDIRLEAPGKTQIHVCDGSSCYVRGSSAILKVVEEKLGIRVGETTPDDRFSLVPADYCLGACDMGPLVQINGTYYGNVTVGQMEKIIDGLLLEEGKQE